MLGLSDLCFSLVFIAQFLEEVIKLDMHEKLASTCQTVYNATLSHHHAWLIRKAAVVAMYALPSKQGLLERVMPKMTFA